MYPKYLDLSKKEFELRIERLFKILERCEICPRKCRVNRLKGERGFCKLGRLPMVSAYHPHFGEENVLVGTGGSGAIFFTSCNLSCVYCQNYEISQLRIGEDSNPPTTLPSFAWAPISFEKLAQMMLELQNKGCHNINLVTPTPQTPQIIKALSLAIEKGLKIPLVYNTNAYDSVETLKLLDGIIDIYMPDAKYSDDRIALKYSNSPKYFEIMKKSIKEMHHQVGDLKLKIKNAKLKITNKGIEGLAYRGVIIRHLVLPNNLAGSEKILAFIAKEISPDTFINIMEQYYPHYKAFEFSEISRRITDEEYLEAIRLAKKFGLKRLLYND